MMLDVDFVELRQGFLQYLPVGALVGVILMVELLMGLGPGSLHRVFSGMAQSRCRHLAT